MPSLANSNPEFVRNHNFCPSLLIAFAALLAWETTAVAYSITGFGPSAYDPDINVLNNNLGINIADYVSEDFDDLNLIPELSQSGTAPVSSTNNGGDKNAWDGARFLKVSGAGTLIWTVNGGTGSFGFGIANDDFDIHTFQVNGGATVDFNAIPNYLKINEIPSNVRWRNGYVFINQEIGDASITTITINNNSTSTVDNLSFDYVAIRTAEPAEVVPAPAPWMTLPVFSIIGVFVMTGRTMHRCLA